MRRRAMVIAVALVLAGCGDDQQRDEPKHERAWDKIDSRSFSDDERKAIAAELAELAKGKNPNDLEGSVAYDAAKDKLIARGSAIEPQLIEAVKGNDDWGVRMGAIEVLAAVGTRRCVEALIDACDDANPLVALHADRLLVGLTDHREIPAAGQPTGSNGLAPVPPRPADDLALDAEERIWAQWHHQYHRALKEAWKAWWQANRGTTKIQ